MNRIAKWKEQASLRKLLIALVVFAALGIPMQASLGELQSGCDSPLMDFLMGYDADTVYYILYSIGESGRNDYLKLIGFDLCFGLVYAAVFFLAIALLLKKTGADRKRDKLLFLPAAAMIFDYTENISTIIQIKRFPEISSAAAFAGSCGTVLKYLFLILCATIIVILVISSVAKKTGR
ncbi:hypothetical protein [Butyricicoccus sp.]|uniref:hypothetical protein n=1 Tax=Butyricicoccus sp. TaxID=2049021 RepID=UPI003F167793